MRRECVHNLRRSTELSLRYRRSTGSRLVELIASTLEERIYRARLTNGENAPNWGKPLIAFAREDRYEAWQDAGIDLIRFGWVKHQRCMAEERSCYDQGKPLSDQR